MGKGWNLPLGLINIFAFGAFLYFRNTWTLAVVCITSSAYLIMLKFISADN
jgi:hypothetical protein